jgi:hypothetical protein
MKIRIQDDSIRFRVTLKEVEELAQSGSVGRQTRVLTMDGPAGEFSYGIGAPDASCESVILVGDRAITLLLSQADLAELLKPDTEGVYIRREWVSATGEVRRFLAFVEKDRPAAACNKPETWIYDTAGGDVAETRAIPRGGRIVRRTE